MTHRPDPAALHQAHRRLRDAITRHYAATAPPTPDPAERPAWAVPGYSPMADMTINPATREARQGVLTRLAAGEAITRHYSAAATRKAQSTTDMNGDKS